MAVCLLMPVVVATDLEIKIKTMPDHEVQAILLKTESITSEVLSRFKNTSDKYGDVSFIYAGNSDFQAIKIFIKKDNENVMDEKFTGEDLEANPVYLELAPSWFEFIATPVNETLNKTLDDNSTIMNKTINTTNDEVLPALLENKETETSSSLTGSAFFGEGGFLSKKTLYFTLGIVVLLIGFLSVGLVRKKLRPKNIIVKKLSEFEAEKKEKIKDKQELIDEAEQKIKEAQEDIRKIRNQDKISQAKKKIIEDEKELMKLREGRE